MKNLGFILLGVAITYTLMKQKQGLKLPPVIISESPNPLPDYLSGILPDNRMSSRKKLGFKNV